MIFLTFLKQKINLYATLFSTHYVLILLCLSYATISVSPIYSPLELWYLINGIYSNIAHNPLNVTITTSTIENSKHIESCSCTGWVLQLLMAKMFYWNGFRGLMIVKILAVCMFVCSTAFCYIKLSRSSVFGILISTLSTSATLEFIELSPYLLGLFFWNIYIYVIYSFLNSTNKQVRSTSLLLFFLCCIAINIDFSTVFLVIIGMLLLCFTASDPSKKIAIIKYKYLILSSFWGLFMTPHSFFASDGATFNKFYLGQLRYTGKAINILMADLYNISHPATVFNYGSISIFILVVMIFLMIIGAGWKPTTGEAITIVSILTICSISTRLNPWGASIAGMVLSNAFGRVGKINVGSIDLAIMRLRNLCLSCPKTGPAWLMFVISVLSIHSLLKEPIADITWPKKEIDYIINFAKSSTIQSVRIINSENISGYIAYRIMSDAKSYPISISITPETKYNSVSKWLDNENMWKASPNWRNILLKETHVKDIHDEIQRSSTFVLVRLIDPLFQILIKDKEEWNPVIIRESMDITTIMNKAQNYAIFDSLGWALFKKIEK